MTLRARRSSQACTGTGALIAPAGAERVSGQGLEVQAGCAMGNGRRWSTPAGEPGRWPIISRGKGVVEK